MFRVRRREVGKIPFRQSHAQGLSDAQFKSARGDIGPQGIMPVDDILQGSAECSSVQGAMESQ